MLICGEYDKSSLMEMNFGFSSMFQNLIILHVCRQLEGKNCHHDEYVSFF